MALALRHTMVRARGLAARILIDEKDHDTVMALGRAHGIRDIVVDGEYGLVQGSVEDRSVLTRYWKTGTWRPTLVGFLKQSLADCGGSVYLDIGANIGLTTIPIARQDGITCLAFEPEPENFRYLCSNVRQNCPGAPVHPYNLALFDRPTTMKFQLSRLHKGDHRLRIGGAGSDDAYLGGRTIEVKAAPLDDVLSADWPTLTGPLVVKIVTQGAESHIAAGGQRTLARAHAITIEIHPYGLKRLGGDASAFIRFCAEQFGSAALTGGDWEGPLDWQPVSSLVDQIAKCYADSADTPTHYFHLYLRKPRP